MSERKPSYRILMGDRVVLRHAKKSRLGTVGVSLRSVKLACVTWDGRKTHDILRWEKLDRAL